MNVIIVFLQNEWSVFSLSPLVHPHCIKFVSPTTAFTVVTHTSASPDLIHTHLFTLIHFIFTCTWDRRSSLFQVNMFHPKILHCIQIIMCKHLFMGIKTVPPRPLNTAVSQVIHFKKCKKISRWIKHFPTTHTHTWQQRQSTYITECISCVVSNSRTPGSLSTIAINPLNLLSRQFCWKPTSVMKARSAEHVSGRFRCWESVRVFRLHSSTSSFGPQIRWLFRGWEMIMYLWQQKLH